MKETPTDNLNTELMSPCPLDTYLQEHSDEFLNMDIAELLDQLYQSKSITKAELARRASISEVYLHQVFSGRRTPSRDRLLCLCIGLGASAEETQSLLQQAHHAPLYARDKRDAVLLFGLSHSLTLPEINDALFTAGAETLL